MLTAINADSQRRRIGSACLADPVVFPLGNVLPQVRRNWRYPFLSPRGLWRFGPGGVWRFHVGWRWRRWRGGRRWRRTGSVSRSVGLRLGIGRRLIGTASDPKNHEREEYAVKPSLHDNLRSKVMPISFHQTPNRIIPRTASSETFFPR
jgi:hypothetical protein